MSIPKIIHYCWFGGAPMPELALKCLDSWKTHCPDYEQVVYEIGGIYLDTDVELRKPLDTFLEHKSFFGFESCIKVATGLGFGAEAKDTTVGQLLSEYDGVPFLLENGGFDLTPCPERNTRALSKCGLIADGTMQILPGGAAIYPQDFFNPKSFETGRITMTPNTVSIHHFDGSWMTPERKKELEEYRKVTKLFGVSTGERILLTRDLLKNEGFAALVRRVFDHFRR